MSDNFSNDVYNQFLVRNTLDEYCKQNTNRQREEIYCYLEEKLNIKIERPAYNYQDGRSNYARVGCEKDEEYENVVNRACRALKEKYFG